MRKHASHSATVDATAAALTNGDRARGDRSVSRSGDDTGSAANSGGGGGGGGAAWLDDGDGDAAPTARHVW
jgi:hypothetical protein